MFESVTKKRKNPIINIFGWFLLSVVCVVFVFIGFSPNSGFLSSGGTAAEVNGKAISLRDFKDLVDRLDSRNQSNGDSRQARRRMEENAINILISRILITQEARHLNVFVGNNEVAQSLLDIEAFYEDGVFSRLRYKTALKQSRLTESEFEDKIRHDLLIQKMSDLIGFVSKDTDFVDEFDEKMDQAQINVSYILLDSGKIKASSGAARAFLNDNPSEVENYYRSHKSEFTVAPKVKARHILVKAKDETKESMDEALKKINGIAAKARLDNFSEMAKKHSQDPGSKSKGGDLGFFGRGQMVPEFEKAAFSASPGEITKPVKTKHGYHILLVDEKREASEKSFDAVKSEIALKLQSRNHYDKLLEQIKTHLKNKKFKDLEIFLGENKLKWSDTGYFGITVNDIPGIGMNQEFLDRAVDLGSHKQYATYPVYKGDHVYILKFRGARMVDKKEAKDKQMDFFKQIMKQQQDSLIVQNWASFLRTRASVKINPKLIR